MNADHFTRLALVAGNCSQFLMEDDVQRQNRRVIGNRTIINNNTFYFRIIKKNVSARRKRSIWSKPRNSCWWTDVVLKKFDDHDWVNNFRVDKELFNQICDMVREQLKPKPSSFRKPISVEKRVAIALYKFASCAEYRVIGNNMGVSKGSVHKSIHLFTNAMLKHVRDVIKMPTEEEAEQISTKFESICHIPQILLIIDGTHIPILAPHESHGDFINSKGWTSYNVQIVADVNYIIRDVSCRYPGASHDAHVFKNSGFFQYINDLLPKKTQLINGLDVNYLVLGDPAYPLLDWLLKGYTGNLDPLQESFNAYMNSARIIIEQTIGKLKSRWRVLKKLNEMDYKFIPKVVIVCCMLHNIIQTKTNPLSDIINAADDPTYDLEQPIIQDMTKNFAGTKSQSEAVRNAIRSVTDSLPIRKQIFINRI